MPIIALVFSINHVRFLTQCDSSFVKAVLEGCKRFSAKSVSTTKRLPILPEDLHALVDKFAGSDAGLPDIRDVCFCLVAFAGFLRFNELCNIYKFF